VFRGRISIQANDHTTYGPRWSAFRLGVDTTEEEIAGNPGDQGTAEDDGAQHFKMPPIAKTWKELTEILSAEGAIAPGCIA
jgi:hypothetical protein